MLDGLVIGRFIVRTEESRLLEPNSDAGTWISIAFIYEDDGSLALHCVRAPAQGGDALEARRQAIIKARRYVRAVVRNERVRAARAAEQRALEA